jgi:hypothetical protein
MKTITRRELYDLVWSKSISKISKETNIKESVIRGICQTYKIPLPINGYWSKIQFGKEVEVFPFVEEFEGSDIIDLYHFNTPVYEVKQKDEVIIIEDFVKEKMPDYPSKLENPLAVIVETQKYLTKKDKYSYYQSRKDDAPYISVQVTSKELIDRSLLFLDTLLKQFIARGHEVLSENWGTKVIIQKNSIPIRMRESYNRVKKKNPTWYDSEDKVANGILCFQIDESYRRVEWKDSASVKLEDKIPNIIAKFEEICYKRYEDDLQKIREDIRKREIYKLIQDRKKVVEIHLEKFNKLLRESKKYRKIQDMRTYVNALKNHENEKPELKEWIEWSNSAIDWYDPLILSDHPYLNDVNRDTLTVKSLDRDVENWYDNYNTHKYGYDDGNDEDDEWEDY